MTSQEFIHNESKVTNLSQDKILQIKGIKQSRLVITFHNGSLIAQLKFGILHQFRFKAVP